MAALGWRSKKQECVALSTTEVEYISLCTATTEAVWLQGLLGFFRVFATHTNDDIPRQSVYDCIGRKRSNFLENQTHKGVVPLYSRQNLGRDNRN